MSNLPPHHILVTTDLSADSTKAYPYAQELAKIFNARLTVLCCIDTSIQFGVGGALDVPVMYVPEALSAVRDRTAKDLKAHVDQHFSGMNVTTTIEEAPSTVSHTIVDFIKNNQVDLTVVASHGRSGISRTFIGSVAEQILRHSSKPVLVVPVKG